MAKCCSSTPALFRSRSRSGRAMTTASAELLPSLVSSLHCAVACDWRCIALFRMLQCLCIGQCLLDVQV